MSTAVGSSLSIHPQSWSVGPYKVEIQQINIVSGDTGATITAANLSRVDAVVVSAGPVILTAQPTISGNVVTLAFTDPAASRYASVVMYGK